MLTEEKIVRGDSYAWTLTFDKDDVVVNITGWTVFFTLKKNWQLPDSEASLQKIITSHTDPVNGQTVLTLLPTDTINLDVGKYDYDIKVLAYTGTAGTAGTINEVYTVTRGKFTIEYNVRTGTAGTSGT
ncbi:MAG: hypothetical protein WC440_02760 [Candidatus Omnitrophota bacterium]|jgi:hypothetical protein